MESVVEELLERDCIKNACVAIVRLEVGQLAGVSSDALRFCFDACVQDTPLAGAALDIVETAGAELLLKEVEIF